MYGAFNKIKEIIQNFEKAVNLLMFAGCCDFDGPEIKKLKNVTSFKLSYCILMFRGGDCLIFSDIVRSLNAEGMLCTIKHVDPFSCNIEIEFGIVKKIELNISLCNWCEGEIDIVAERIRTNNEYLPHFRGYDI